MKSLEEKLEYHFQNRELLENALTHSSCANESRGKLHSNERLEFLGDSILGMVVADHLYRNHPDLPEGELTRTRAALVCEESLVEVAQSLGLGSYLRLGKGEEAGGGRKRPSIQADAVEAVLAAVYLDGGIGSVRKIIQKYILSREVAGLTKPRDYKTALQELVQRESGQVLQYRLTGEEGPDHDKRFFIAVDLNGTAIGTGNGRSKKEAEQMAAKAAIESLTTKAEHRI
ncbi:MAG: ribonuclease III [Lawsonibacter sp.]|jgi:ribonuclease-3